MPSAARDASVLALLKACASVAAVLAGFVAVSDDDFARVVIAQRFAESPSFDPSGTSWLPAPFWIHGSAMLGLGPSITGARAVAACLGILGVLFLYSAARAGKLSRRAAFVGAVLVAWLPHSIWLGVATVPEMWTAALWVGALCTTQAPGRWRLAGAAALLVASLSRYETWPIACVFSAFCMLDARRRAAYAWTAAALALGGPLLWLLHGAVDQGDPLFFVDRVTAYRQALRGTLPLADRLLRYPLALVTAEPELALATALGCVAARRERPWRTVTRPLIGAATVFGFLTLSDVIGGGPTHHPERALLGVWFVACLLVGQAAAAFWARAGAERSARQRLVAGAAVTLAVCVGVAVRVGFPVGQFAARSTERDIGRVARSHTRPGQRVAIDTPDFGFFAIMAAIGRPEDAIPLDRHDPRKPGSSEPFSSRATLRQRLDAEGAEWLVAHRSHVAVASTVGATTAQNADFSLIRVSK